MLIEHPENYTAHFLSQKNENIIIIIIIIIIVIIIIMAASREVVL